MTDHYNAFIVVLDKDLRSDDAQATINAIGRIQGVIKVQPYSTDVASVVAEARVRMDLGKKMYEILFPPSRSA